MIHVFKTSVQTDQDITTIQPILDRQAEILQWNFDLDDCDNILRVDAPETAPPLIMALLKQANFDAQELH